MTPKEILDREFDIVDRYKIRQNFETLTIRYTEDGQEYVVHCEDEKGLRNLSGFLVQALIVEEGKK